MVASASDLPGHNSSRLMRVEQGPNDTNRVSRQRWKADGGPYLAVQDALSGEPMQSKHHLEEKAVGANRQAAASVLFPIDGRCVIANSTLPTGLIGSGDRASQPFRGER